MPTEIDNNVNIPPAPQMPTPPQSMGLTGIIATIANTTEVVVVTSLLVWFLTIMSPAEHERAAVQRQIDRDVAAVELKAFNVKLDAEIAKARDREDARMQKLWDKQTELKTAIDAMANDIKNRK